MYFFLVPNHDDLEWDAIGPVCEIPYGSDQVDGYYPLKNGWDDAELFELDIDDIDRICGALLDIGDVAFFNSEQCVKLEAWIEERLDQSILPRYRELLEVLRDYCQRAVKLGTGVYIDL